MKDQKVLLITAIVLAIFCLINIQLEILSNRWLRLITSGIFFLLALKIVTLKKIVGLSIFAFLTLCDYLLLEWETMFAKHIYYVVHSIIILSFIFLTIREMDWRKISFFEIGSAALFLLINTFIFLSLREFFTIEDLFLKTLFSINGFLIVILVVLAFFYSINRPNNNIATYFFLGILGMVVSDLMLFSIYFLDMQTFLYLDSFFYVIGLYFLLRASHENKSLDVKMFTIEEKENKSEDTNIYH